jgi:NAD-dependent SIR2 family protein deacetylase
MELHGSIFECRRLVLRKLAPCAIEELIQVVARLAMLRDRGTNFLSIVRSLDPLIRIKFNGIWIPHVVLFGQGLPPGVFDRASREIEQCDCLIVVGTSLNVVPAADLVLLALRAKVPIIQVDSSPGRVHCVVGRATEVLPAILNC